MIRKLASIIIALALATYPAYAQTPPRTQGSPSTTTENLEMVGCVRADAAAVAAGVANGDRARCIVDADGKLWVNVGTVTVTGTVTANQGGTWNITDITGTVNLPTGAATNAKLDAVIAALAAVGITSSVLPSGASTSAKQDTIIGHIDGIETLLTAIDGRVDQLEGYLDGVEASLTTIIGHVDGLEGFVDGIEGQLTTIDGRVDGIEALLTTIDGRVDGIEALLTTANTDKIKCNNNAWLNMTTATTTEIVALSASTVIYVCSFSIMTSAATNVKFVSGTGTNCATSQADRSSNMHFIATMPGIARGSGEGMVVKSDAGGDALCITSSAAVNVDIDISYARF